MNVSKLDTIEQIQEFLDGTAQVAFSNPTDASALRTFVEIVLRRYRYLRLSKGPRGVLFAYMQRLTGYSRQHLSRLITQYRESHSLKPRKRVSRTSFARQYTVEDIALLAQTDSLHDTLSGPATKVLLRRASTTFGDARYAQLAQISVSHLYNLRASQSYRKQRLVWHRTRPAPVAIGIRKAPAPQGVPGYIRIDTVHQGDLDGLKGVYHINAVDMALGQPLVTQWELVASVEHISEAYLLPVIALLLEGFPFAIRGFHSDSGSEYVNHKTAELLEKLRVEFTKSRPRQTNDNALAECKNGAVVRKTMGYSHIPQQYATAINDFYIDVLNPYLNFHRPCYFAVDTIDAKGKIRKTYPHNQIMTPWERLKTIPTYETYLKPGVTTQSLEHEANSMSDNDAARQVQQARKRLFHSFNRRSKSVP
ncbi:MAG: integrase [Pseudomonadota bacterium]|nr:integrase [Pseudomonadota bacterium]